MVRSAMVVTMMKQKKKISLEIPGVLQSKCLSAVPKRPVKLTPYSPNRLVKTGLVSTRKMAC